MDTREEGFGSLEAILILIIVAILGFTGWYIYHSNKKINEALSTENKVSSAAVTTAVPLPAPKFSSTTTAYTDAMNAFSVSYPSSWTVTQQPPSDCCSQSDHTSPLIDATSAVVIPPNSPSVSSVSTAPNGILINAFRDSNTTRVFELIFPEPALNKVKYRYFTTNNNQAIFSQAGGKAYNDDAYFVTHKNVTVEVLFRVKQTNFALDASTFDMSNDLGDFAAIAHSIKFLN